MKALDKAIFAADLHVHPFDTGEMRDFIGLLDRYRDHEFFVLGDLFDCYFGPGCLALGHMPRFADEIRKRTARGTRINFLVGNRDFLFTGAAVRALGIVELPDVFTVKLAAVGTAILSHGDLFMSADCSYQRYRRVIRSRLMRRLAQTLPEELTRTLALRLQAYSDAVVPKKGRAGRQVDPATVLRYLGDGDIAIVGHVHNRGHMPLDNRKSLYILDAFADERGYLRYGDGRLEFETWKA